MSINVRDIFDQILSHAMASGLFETVNGHEPGSAPANGGLHAALWVQDIAPAVGQSGLDATSVRIGFNLRIYSSMLQEPQDAIDPNILTAVDVLLDALSDDFQLGATVRDIDLLGHSGEPLSARAGYINQDGRLYRVMTIAIPVVVNDAWTQVG